MRPEVEQLSKLTVETNTAQGLVHKIAVSFLSFVSSPGLSPFHRLNDSFE